ncbi:MAG TPA: peptide chain release factor N(5)-glutamine methyltransferase, partial [Candidatus Kapabacteria bacterium]|nr:peptide chain release factor N(5)-glutamine methyltransferase [Candidatus Kapabacteria bacterium]
EYLLAHPEIELTKAQYEKFASFAERRSAGEPVAYIVGKKEFYNLEFIVDKNVLIPRPETELLVDNVVKNIQVTRYQIPDTIIDVGTGSGNVIVSIAKFLPAKIKNKMKFFAFDISKESLGVAKENAKKHRVEKKIKFIQSDLLEYFFKNKKELKNIFVIANLPYISPKIYQSNKNNLKYEPKQALVSSDKGLSHYNKLFEQVRLLFKDRCSLNIEISPEQKPEISRILKDFFPKSRLMFHRDLAGKWRVAEASPNC